MLLEVPFLQDIDLHELCLWFRGHECTSFWPEEQLQNWMNGSSCNKKERGPSHPPRSSSGATASFIQSVDHLHVDPQ